MPSERERNDPNHPRFLMSHVNISPETLAANEADQKHREASLRAALAEGRRELDKIGDRIGNPQSARADLVEAFEKMRAPESMRLMSAEDAAAHAKMDTLLQQIEATEGVRGPMPLDERLAMARKILKGE